MSQEWLLEIISALIVIPMGFVYLYVLIDEWRFPRKIIKKILILFVLGIVALDIMIFLDHGVGRRGKNLVGIMDLAVIQALILYLVQFHQGRTLFVCFSIVNFLNIGCILGEVIASFSVPGRMFIKVAVAMVVFWIIYRYFRIPMRELMEQIEGGWKRMSLIPLFFGILFMWLLQSGKLYYDFSMKVLSVAAVLAGSSTYIILYQVFYFEKKRYQIQANCHLLEAQMNSLQKQLETMQNVNHTFDIFRHDMRHFLQIQKACLDNGDVEGAKQILSSIGHDLEQDRLRIKRHTDCTVIDAVLSNYGKKAEGQGISFIVHLILPRGVAKDPIELAVVIANSLENAYNACCRMDRGQKRIISLRGYVEKEQFFLEVANTYDGTVRFNKEKTMPVTDRKGHGYGTQSVLAFAGRHQGYVNYSAENGWFKLRLIVSLNEEEGYKITD